MRPGGVERAPVVGPAGEVEQDQAGGEMFHILYFWLLNGERFHMYADCRYDQAHFLGIRPLWWFHSRTNVREKFLVSRWWGSFLFSSIQSMTQNMTDVVHVLIISDCMVLDDWWFDLYLYHTSITTEGEWGGCEEGLPARHGQHGQAQQNCLQVL